MLVFIAGLVLLGYFAAQIQASVTIGYPAADSGLPYEIAGDQFICTFPFTVNQQLIINSCSVETNAIEGGGGTVLVGLYSVFSDHYSLFGSAGTIVLPSSGSFANAIWSATNGALIGETIPAGSYCIGLLTSESIQLNGENTNPLNGVNLLASPFSLGLPSTVTSSQLPDYASGQNTAAVAFQTWCDGTVSGSSGDPTIYGLRGQVFQVHGIDGEIYNMISDNSLQFNGLFKFLDSGVCQSPMPVETACWSHPGSYITEMGFVLPNKDRIQVTSGSLTTGLNVVYFSNTRSQSMTDGSSQQSLSAGGADVYVNGTHQVTIVTEKFHFVITNSDNFLNEEVETLVRVSTLNSHGLLGQTHSRKRYNNQWRYIEGTVDDYIIASRDLFESDFLYNKFDA